MISLRRKIITGQVVGFILIAGVSVVNELLTSKEISHAVTELAIALIVAVVTIYYTIKITNYLNYIISFVRICSYCNKIFTDNKWITVSVKLRKGLDQFTPTHGICTDCYIKERFK